MVPFFLTLPLVAFSGHTAEGTSFHGLHQANFTLNSTVLAGGRPAAQTQFLAIDDALFVADRVWARAVAAQGRDTGKEELLMSSVKWCVIWVFSFYMLAAGLPPILSAVPSKKEHENDKFWIARCVLGIFHAILISALALPVLIGLLGASQEARFFASDDLATCSVDPIIFGAAVARDGRAIALAGLAFTTFTATDVMLSLTHGLMTWDHMIHHAAFVGAGIIIRGHCILPFSAAVLLSMEVSTPFLNSMLLFRYRGERYGTFVMANGCVFFVLFVIFRLGFNTLGTVLLWYSVAKGEAFDKPLPVWEVVFLMAAVTVGTLVQYFWFPSIARIFMGKVFAPPDASAKRLDESDSNSSLPASDNSSEEK